ncbi:MAG: cell envelope integrity protein TolA [Pseudomonadota bacterium]
MLHADARPAPVLETRRALNRSLILHLLVLGAVLGLPYLHKPPEPVETPSIQAMLVAPSVVSRPAPRPVEPEPAPVEPPPVVEQQVEVPPPVKTPSKIQLPKVAEKTPPKPAKPVPPTPILKKSMLNTASLDEEMKALQNEARQNERDRMLREMEGQAVAMRASANQAIVDRYSALIQAAVQDAWERPPSARAGMVVTLRISMLPGGELANVMPTRSSGDPAFDASAVAAVKEAARRKGRLPVPDDAAVFSQNFRNFSMNFRPEDPR